MEYGLTGRLERDVFFVPLDAAAFERIKLAKSALIECISIEETYDILIENYLEFETAVLNLAAREMVTHSLHDYDSFHTARSRLDRHLANLLSASRMYQDHVPQRLHRAMPDSRPEIKEKLREQYDKWLGYRCMEALRNHVQHSGLPVHSVTAEHQWTSLDENGMLLFGITPYLDARQLKSNPDFKKKVLREIEDAGGRIDIKETARQYMEGLSVVHAYVRDLVATSCEEWRLTLDDAIARVNEAAEGRGNVWWTTAVRAENDEQVEQFEVLTEFIVRLTHLQRKNEAPLTNLSRRFASSQLTSK